MSPKCLGCVSGVSRRRPLASSHAAGGSPAGDCTADSSREPSTLSLRGEHADTSGREYGLVQCIQSSAWVRGVRPNYSARQAEYS